MKKETTAAHYGIEQRVFAWKVVFYEGGEKVYKQGAAADKFARKSIMAGKWCSLHALTIDGWIEAAAC